MHTGGKEGRGVVERAQTPCRHWGRGRGVLRPRHGLFEVPKLLIERGNRLLEHTFVSCRAGAAEVLACARPCQFQGVPALLDDAVSR